MPSLNLDVMSILIATCNYIPPAHFRFVMVTKLAQFVSASLKIENPVIIKAKYQPRGNCKMLMCHLNCIDNQTKRWIAQLCWKVQYNPDDPTEFQAILHSIMLDSDTGEFVDITPGNKEEFLVLESRATTLDVKVKIKQYSVMNPNTMFAAFDSIYSRKNYEPDKCMDFFQEFRCPEPRIRS